LHKNNELCYGEKQVFGEHMSTKC